MRTYTVAHSAIMLPSRVLRAGDIVTSDDIAEFGGDEKSLKNLGAIEPATAPIDSMEDASSSDESEASLRLANLEKLLAQIKAKHANESGLQGITLEGFLQKVLGGDGETDNGDDADERSGIVNETTTATQVASVEVSGGGNTSAQPEIPATPVQTAQTVPVSSVATPSATTESVGTASTPLPLDFPKRDALIAAGYDTLEKVKALTTEQLAAINGVGPAAIDAITKAVG